MSDKATPIAKESNALGAAAPAPKRARYKLWEWLLLLFLLGVFTVWQYGTWEAGQLRVQETNIPAPTLPGTGELTIAYFADVHDNREMLAKAIDEITAARPDLILFGGDLIEASSRLKRTRWFIQDLSKLAKVAPVYAILGNHDMEKLLQVERIYQEAGITLLRNERVEWSTPQGAKLTIIGLGDWNEGDDKPSECMKPRGEEEHPVLLLVHDPESCINYDLFDWQMMLCGHTHGGQLGNPLTGEAYSLRSSMPAGRYEYKGQSKALTPRPIFVTRGVGSTKGMRFFCRPEVNIFRLGK